MTFTRMVAEIDRRVQLASVDGPWVARLDVNPNQSLWTSGPYTVLLAPIDSEVTLVRFTSHGQVEPQYENPGWLQTQASAVQLARTMAIFFGGGGLALRRPRV